VCSKRLIRIGNASVPSVQNRRAAFNIRKRNWIPLFVTTQPTITASAAVTTHDDTSTLKGDPTDSRKRECKRELKNSAIRIGASIRSSGIGGILVVSSSRAIAFFFAAMLKKAVHNESE